MPRFPSRARIPQPAPALQADLKTFSALGVYGATVVTAVTAQNTTGVTAVHLIPAEIVTAQIDAVFSDLSIGAVKTGMLGSVGVVEAVARGLAHWAGAIPFVFDPVMVSTSGNRLLEARAELAFRGLIPQAALITPNLHEAAALLNSDVAQSEDDARKQAERLFGFGPGAVLIKGGHASGAESADLFYNGSKFRTFSAPRIATQNTHGTGCTLASAIAAFLVKGLPMEDAIAEAKTYLQGAIQRAADGTTIGSGPGPVPHFYRGLSPL